jgi:hypothetical protein
MMVGFASQPPHPMMVGFRLVFGLLLLAALACFGAGLFKRDPRWHRLGAVILKWTLIAALGFFAVLIVQRLLGH